MQHTRPAAIELDPRLEYLVCTCIREGLSLVDACRAVNLPERTARRWLSLGRRNRAQVYADFAAAIAAAEAERQHHVRQVIAEVALQHAGRL